MKRPLVLGSGNPLRGDDGVGPLVTARVAEAEPGVDVLIVHQLTPELAEAIAAAASVVFVDARRDSPPGCVRVERVKGASSRACFTHYTTPADLVALAESLYGFRGRAWLVTVGGADFELGEGLSLVCLEAVPEVVRAVTTAIDEAGSGDRELRSYGDPV